MVCVLPWRRRCADGRPFSASDRAAMDTRAPSGLHPPRDPSKNNPLWPAASAPPQPGSPPPPPSRWPVAGRGIKLALRLLVNSRPLQFDHLDQFAEWTQLGFSAAASFRGLALEMPPPEGHGGSPRGIFFFKASNIEPCA